jgi:hypothetical protein
MGRNKQRCIAVALCLLLGLAGCAQGKSQPKEHSKAPEPSAQMPAQSRQSEQDLPLRSESYAALLKEGTYYLDCTALLTVEGLTLSNDMLIAVRGEDCSVTISGDLGGLPSTLRVLTLGAESYLMDDENRTYSPIDGAALQGAFDTDFSRLTYRGSGEDAFDTATLFYEEYAEGDGRVRFFFDGDRLLGLTRTVLDTQVDEIALRINGLSGNIPDRTLELPIGYTRQDAA